MFILFGTRGLKHAVNDSPAIPNACPNCSNGNLVHKLYRRWFTLFFIPVIPLDVIDRFYECDKCSSAYNESVKEVLERSQEEIDNAEKEAKATYAKALIASMTHMSTIDNHLDEAEEREINDAIAQFPELSADLVGIYEHVKLNGNKDNQVFNLLNEARNSLSQEALVNLLAQAAVILLADGNIEKEEEALMKEYLIACGLPKDLYPTLIGKLKAKDIKEIGAEQLN